ncbi:hypothetical protein NPIL_426391, partial [Nephila pilipes]
MGAENLVLGRVEAFILKRTNPWVWAPGDHSMGPRPTIFSIVGIVSSAPRPGRGRTESISPRSQSPICDQGVDPPVAPPLVRQDWTE